MLYRRRIQDVALQMMDEIPVVMLQGPRTVGKSTLLGEMARPFGGGILDLDNPAVLERAPFEPDVFAGAGPVFIDEYQKLPETLDQIKAALNRGGANGRFVLTGSARHDALPRGAQALTGRLYRVPVLPLAQVEMAGVGGNFVEDAFERLDDLAASGASVTTRDQYMEKALVGGFPMAVASPDEEARGRWFDQYVSLSIMEDARDLRRFHRPDRLPRLLRRLAAQTGQRLNISKAGNDTGINNATAHVYTRLMEAVFLLDLLPAWTETDLGPARRPKVHMVDSGVAGRLLGLTTGRLRSRDPVFADRFGRLLETFVVGEVRKMVPWLGGAYRYKMGYWHRSNGEVDLVVERPSDGGVLGIEVKAGQRIRPDDTRGLRLLREELGDRFIAGLLMNTGDRPYRLEDRIYVMPIDKLWRGEAAAPSGGGAGDPQERKVMAGGGRFIEDIQEEDPLPAFLRAAASRLAEEINPEGFPYWEIALIPDRPVLFEDFYTSDGVVGALGRAQEAQSVEPSFGLGAGGRVEVRDRVAVLTDAGRGVLVHQRGSMAAVAVCGRAFLTQGGGAGVTGQFNVDHRMLTGWVFELARFAHRELLPHLPGPHWTFWSAGRRLQSRDPSLSVGDHPLLFRPHTTGIPHSTAVADNPAHKAVDPSHDPETDGFGLLASFYEWFGVPARLLPGAEQRRLVVPPDIR